MEITVNNKYCIITPLSPKMDSIETDRLLEEILRYKNKRIGIDLSEIEDCTIDFLEKINKIKNINLFNITSNIMVLLLSMNLDKKINLFASKIDFLEDKRQILNRKFKLI